MGTDAAVGRSAPLVPVKLALIAAGDATLPAPLSSSFLLDHVSFDAYLDRLKQGAEGLHARVIKGCCLASDVAR